MLHKVAVLTCLQCRTTGVAAWTVDAASHRHEVLKTPDGFSSADGVGRDDRHYFICTRCKRIADKAGVDPATCRARADDARKQAALTPREAQGWNEIAGYWDEIANAFEKLKIAKEQ